MFITLAVIAGSTWAFIELKTGWIAEPKIAISFFTWGIYLALVFLRVTAGWRGRKAAIMTVTVLGFSALTWAAHARLGSLLFKSMKLLITGVSHKTAPVEVRECLAFREEALPAALADLKSREGVAEAVILSTCNRVEITLTTDDALRPAGHRRRLPGRSQSRRARHAIGPHLYRHEGRDAIHHLFRVAASLDSMVVGEPQILGQLKAAYAAAKDCGALCGWLDGLMTRAFSVAKRVRSETGIGQMAVSVSYAAVELARKIFGSLANRTDHDRRRRQDVANWRRATCAAPGASHVFVTNRTHERAVEMAAAVPGHAGRIHALHRACCPKWIS